MAENPVLPRNPPFRSDFPSHLILHRPYFKRGQSVILKKDKPAYGSDLSQFNQSINAILTVFSDFSTISCYKQSLNFLVFAQFWIKLFKLQLFHHHWHGFLDSEWFCSHLSSDNSFTALLCHLSDNRSHLIMLHCNFGDATSGEIRSVWFDARDLYTTVAE